MSENLVDQRLFWGRPKKIVMSIVKVLDSMNPINSALCLWYLSLCPLDTLQVKKGYCHVMAHGKLMGKGSFNHFNRDFLPIFTDIFTDINRYGSFYRYVISVDISALVLLPIPIYRLILADIGRYRYANPNEVQSFDDIHYLEFI